MKLVKLIFSPTGGTKRVADLLADGLGFETETAELAAGEAALPVLAAEDICLVAVPSFGGRVPVCALESLAKVKGSGARAILVAVYGNRAFEDTLVELADAAEAAGLRPVAAVAAVAEHSIARQFGAGRPDADDVHELQKFAAAIREKLAGDAAEPLVLPGNRPYKERGSSTLRPVADETCTACGLCVSSCPVGALDAAAPAQAGNEACIACMRCVSVCPAGARKLPAAMLEAVSQRLAQVCSERKQNELFL